ncbi:TonB-dependent receptor, partial [mine drainage metagenome]
MNRLAEADINAEANKKIQDNTGAMTIVGRKKFAENQTTGIGYVLMQTPSVNYYSRSGANGITGGMNYFMCRGYTTGGSNSAPSGGSNIEFSVEGVPQNVNQDGGMVYDLNLMNNDISSVDIQRGVTTSQQLGNYASGCAINIHLV